MKNQLRGILGLIGHCHNWIPNFSLVAQLIYTLLKLDQSGLIQWNPEVKQYQKTKEKLI